MNPRQAIAWKSFHVVFVPTIDMTLGSFRPETDSPELAMALRQCDGHSIECLLLVRDDFWLALSRFLSLLEVPIQQHRNAMLVDLFSVSHARKVLADLGVAYGRLPSDPNERTPDQNQFLDRVVHDLAEDGKIFPVRMTLFVEMVKDSVWELATLQAIGGIHGVGLQCLEESFSSQLAPAAQRTHESAVRQESRSLDCQLGGYAVNPPRALWYSS